MNAQKKLNINIEKKPLRKTHQKIITKKSSIDNLNNICIIPKKELYQTIVINKISTKFHSKSKKQDKKPSSCYIKSRKSLKTSTTKFKNSKNFKEALYDLLSLSSSGDSFNNKKKNKDKKELAHNTINAINHRIKLFNNTNYNNYNKNNNKIKYKSIEATRTKFRQILYPNYYKNFNKEDKNSRKKNRINIKENDYNNIIINFFNAPISKYNKEYYINNFTTNNTNNMNAMNNIYKDKQSKKSIFQILNHVNNIKNLNSNYNINNNFNNFSKDYKNIFPVFSYINTGNNNININNINNYNEIECQSTYNKARKRCNTSENLIPLSNNNNNILNNHNRIISGSKSKKNSKNKEKDKYLHKDKNKFIKNKKLQSLQKELNIIEKMNAKIQDKNKKLKNIFKKQKNNSNLNTINKSLTKNYILNIKKDYFIHSNTINNDSSHKNNDDLNNFLSRIIINIENKNNNKSSKNKINQKYFSFNRFIKNNGKEAIINYIRENARLNTYKSIDVDDSKKRLFKMNNFISSVFPFQKFNKNHQNKFFNNEKVYSSNNRVFINSKKSSKKNKNFNTIINNNILSNRISHFNISNTKYNNIKKINNNPKRTIDTKKRVKKNNAIKIKTTTENKIKDKKSVKTEENLNKIIKDFNNNLENDDNETIKNIEVNKFNSLKELELKISNPQYIEEYLDEILCNLFLEEKIYLEDIGFQISSDFLNSYGINPETRTCLIDSLIDLQKIFNFNERTLFITVQLFDRFLTTSIIKDLPKLEEEDLDIILTTSLLIASKIEESILYKLTDYLGILSDKYTTNNIIEMEDKILNVLNFNVVIPTMLDFFEVFAEKIKLDQLQKNKGLFLLNIVLLDINLSQISGSVIAYSIINFISGKDCSFLLKKINQIYNNVKKYKNKNDNLDAFYLLNNKEKIKELSELINVFSKGILKTEYNHVYKKFNCQKFDFVSKIMSDGNIISKESANESFNS